MSLSSQVSRGWFGMPSALVMATQPHERDVLRLTVTTYDRSRPNLRAEGRLVGEWSELLESECRRVLSQSGAVDLDLRGVTDLDAAGVGVLRRLRDESGTRLTCTPIVLALLTEETQP